MKRGALLAALFLVAGAAHAFTEAPFWFRDYQKCFKFARERRQPIIVVFGLSTTKATHELLVRLKEDPELEHALDGFARVELEEPDQGIAASVYGIWVVPTLVILDRYEREVGRLSFPQADEQWRQELLAMCARAQDPSSNVAVRASDDGAGAPAPLPVAPQTGAAPATASAQVSASAQVTASAQVSFDERDFAVPQGPAREPSTREILSRGQRVITARPPGRAATAARIQAIAAGLTVRGGNEQP